MYNEKKFGKNRVFLNPKDYSCMAAIGWYVVLRYNDGTSSTDGEKRGYLDASLKVNEEGQSWWVSRKAHFKQLNVAMREMQAFKIECQRAMRWAKDNGYKLDKD